jgi:hypothetical protein
MKTIIVITFQLLFLNALSSIAYAQKHLPPLPWPSGNNGGYVDGKEQNLNNNSSGATFDKDGYLWIVKNDPATLYKLHKNSEDKYINVAKQNWGCRITQQTHSCGKQLRYANGKGNPDAEGITITNKDSYFAYVVTERDGDNKKVRRYSILRYPISGDELFLTATHEWNLTADIASGFSKRFKNNKGLEAITWIPDEFLQSEGFIDESKKKERPYFADNYCGHYGGVFFVGLEKNPNTKENTYIYAYVLMENGGFVRIARIDAGWEQVVGLEFDQTNNKLWAICDNDRNNPNQIRSFHIKDGKFSTDEIYEPPAEIYSKNFEGLAIDTHCDSSAKQAFLWINDDGTDHKTVYQACR